MDTRRQRVRYCVVWLSACCAGAVGCSAYDPTFLEHPVMRSGSGSSRNGGAGAAGASNRDASNDVDSGAAPELDTDGGEVNEFRLADGGLVTRCGDGRVTGSESCDVAIASGQPGACPTANDCGALGACLPRAINNADTCQAECVVLAANCQNGDGCCPATCSASNDSDCSGSCHDGVVETDKGETCEPDSKTTPCKTLADCDDGDPCTADSLTGSPDNCNVACVHTPITALHSGDGCCPSGGNNNTDGDCAPVCGNGVVENGEQCDGSEGCSTDCKQTTTTMPPSNSTSCNDADCTNTCFPAGILPCCTPSGDCGCTWAPGAYCL